MYNEQQKPIYGSQIPYIYIYISLVRILNLLKSKLVIITFGTYRTNYLYKTLIQVISHEIHLNVFNILDVIYVLLNCSPLLAVSRITTILCDKQDIYMCVTRYICVYCIQEIKKQPRMKRKELNKLVAYTVGRLKVKVRLCVCVC